MLPSVWLRHKLSLIAWVPDNWFWGLLFAHAYVNSHLPNSCYSHSRSIFHFSIATVSIYCWNLSRYKYNQLQLCEWAIDRLRFSISYTNTDSNTIIFCLRLTGNWYISANGLHIFHRWCSWEQYFHFHKTFKTLMDFTAWWQRVFMLDVSTHHDTTQLSLHFKLCGTSCCYECQNSPTALAVWCASIYWLIYLYNK